MRAFLFKLSKIYRVAGHAVGMLLCLLESITEIQCLSGGKKEPVSSRLTSALLSLFKHVIHISLLLHLLKRVASFMLLLSSLVSKRHVANPVIEGYLLLTHFGGFLHRQ